MRQRLILPASMVLVLLFGCVPTPSNDVKEVSPRTTYDQSLYPGQFLESNGIELYYEKRGKGPYLILIEGLGVETWLYENNIPALSNYFTTIVYDNRGVGHSGKPEGPYTIDMMVGDLTGLMDALEIKTAIIMGASMGGFIAMEFAIRHPERVEKLVLLSTTAGGKAHIPMGKKTLVQLLKAPEGSPRNIIRDRLSMAYSNDFMKDSVRVNHLIDLRLQNPQPKYAYKAQASIGPKFDASDRLHLITAPTFIGHGQEDILVPVGNAETLHKNIPNSILRIYENLEHQFFVEDYQTFNSDLINFLRE